MRATAALAVRDERLVPDLGRVLADAVPGVRAAAAVALARFPAALPLLLGATADAEPEVVETALRGIEALGDARALSRIERLGSSPQPRVRAAAAHALVALGGVTSHGPALDAALHDRETGVRVAAIAGIREHPVPEAVSYLETLLPSPETRIRHEVAMALGAIPSPGSARLLRTLSRDSEPEIRAAAVSGLASSQDTDLVAALAPLCKDSSEVVRSAVADALGRIGRPEGLAALRSLARDVYTPVRLLVAISAARIGTESALPVLDLLRRDGDVHVRLETIRAIGSLPFPGALSSLREEAARARGPVRIAAIEQLGARRDRESAALLRRYLDDPDESLRVAARRALEEIEPAGTAGSDR
jgi:HEAT repeat protein